LNSTITQTGLLEDIRQWVGQDRCFGPGAALDQNLQNTSHFTPPDVKGWVRPSAEEQLPAILEICRRHKTPVYTISKGLNWGLGSRLPVEPGCLLLDLGDLNRIMELDEELHYAIVEPGVTQEQLSSEIRTRGLQVMLNVTGSAPQTSVLGNSLERGSGFLEHRYNDIRGLEVLLADGTKIRSGFWNEQASERGLQHFPMGIGPDWKGLFSQSNLGIVTKAVIQLYPKKEVQKMLWCKVEQEHLPALVEAIRDLYQRKYLSSVTHIGNDKRMKIEHKNALQTTTWTAMAMVQGSPAFVRFLEEEIPVYLKPLCLSMGFLTQEEAEASELGPVFGCHIGIPTDYFVRAMYKSEDADPDKENLQIDFGRYGMLCCLPILPARAKDIADAVAILESIDRDFGILPAATLNPMNDLALESVINIYFDRNDPEAVTKAHAANEEMIARFYQSGYRFYRFDVKVMGQYLDPENPHWQLVSRLKQALDPDRLLSPGRYEARR
jgi:4-cresol dehydrogenase (hydroxylating) flavoprotein subunit